MPAASDRSTLIAALEEVWGSLAELGRSLSDADWDTPTDLPRWSVRDNYSHIIGTELMLLGRNDPEVDLPDSDHVRNDIGRMNEHSVERRRTTPGAEMVAELVAVTTERLGVLSAMSDDDFAADSFTPAGPDTYGRFMQVRVMDCWLHEQDVREALGRPGALDGLGARVAFDEMANAIGFVVGKKAGAVQGQSVRLALTGPTSRTFDIRVDGRAALVDDLEDPTATVTMPASLFWRYAGGRRPGDPDHADVALAGDLDLARRVVTNAAYMI